MILLSCAWGGRSFWSEAADARGLLLMPDPAAQCKAAAQQPAQAAPGLWRQCSHRKAVGRRWARGSATDIEAPPANAQQLQHSNGKRHPGEPQPAHLSEHLAASLGELAERPLHSLQQQQQQAGEEGALQQQQQQQQQQQPGAGQRLHRPSFSAPDHEQAAPAPHSAKGAAEAALQPASPWLAKQPPSAADSLEEATPAEPWQPDWDKFEYLCSGSLSSLDSLSASSGSVDQVEVRTAAVPAHGCLPPCLCLHCQFCQSAHKGLCQLSALDWH